MMDPRRLLTAAGPLRAANKITNNVNEVITKFIQ